jgi:hypothetical protein
MPFFYRSACRTRFTGTTGTTYRHWHFTLMNLDGDVLVTTHPKDSGYGVGGFRFTNKFKHHFEEVFLHATSC